MKVEDLKWLLITCGIASLPWIVIALYINIVF